MIVDDELSAIYRAEVAEQIELLQQGLQAAPSSWDMDAFFRASHNIKGAARMVDAGEVMAAAHKLEDLFSELRESKSCTPEQAEVARAECRLLSAVFDGAIQVPGAPQGEEAIQANTLRVSIDKLEKLFEMSAGLAAAGYRMEERQQAARELQTHLESLAGHSGIQRLSPAILESHHLRRNLVQDRAQFDLLAAQLQDAIRALRMVRFDNLRGPLSKAVREAAEQTGKQVVLLFEGASTEIDRKTLEGLSDPLVHLLRNAVAHGAEMPGDRLQAGKPPHCQVQITARSTGTWVEVSVSDDGQGMSVEQIRLRAIARGLISAGKASELTPEEIYEFAFQPGFSTAETVNELFGRGVGLDVVRQNIAGIGGHVHLTSVEGMGTAFYLRVPLTRLTTKCILVRVGKQYAALPIGSVERTLRAAVREVREIEGKSVLSVFGGHVPIERLGALLGFKADDQPDQPVVIISELAEQCALFVDEVLGEKELVIQRLSWNLKRVPGLTGATVIDGGRICLILDAAQLLKRVGRNSRNTWSNEAATVHKRHRILLADDSLTSRTLEKNILTAAGYDVVLASDGEEAWRRLQEGNIELLLSDVEMPNLNGFDLTRRVRLTEQFRSLPVILVTSLGNEEHKEAGAEAGANAYIVKGVFDQDVLLKAVKRHL